jgi:hypothetical protein
MVTVLLSVRLRSRVMVAMLAPDRNSRQLTRVCRELDTCTGAFSELPVQKCSNAHRAHTPL